MNIKELIILASLSCLVWIYFFDNLECEHFTKSIEEELAGVKATVANIKANNPPGTNFSSVTLCKWDTDGKYKQCTTKNDEPEICIVHPTCGQNTKEQKSSSGSSAGLIVGAIVAVVIVLGLGGYMFYGENAGVRRERLYNRMPLGIRRRLPSRKSRTGRALQAQTTAAPAAAPAAPAAAPAAAKNKSQGMNRLRRRAFNLENKFKRMRAAGAAAGESWRKSGTVV